MSRFHVPSVFADDGYNDLVFGAPQTEGDSVNSGIVYVVPGLAP